MAWTFEATQAGYTKLWKSATLKGGQDGINATTFADKIIAAEARYRAVQNAIGVPWYFIGALHMRESSCNFAGVLHNGDQIIGTGRLTYRVPAGRGPFATWEASAIDALKLKDMHRVQHWSAARMLYQAEVFNGLGYVSKGINSPYVWAGTNHEQRGKYVADHVFDPNADDVQLGVAAVLIRLAEKRQDIRADLYPSTPEPLPMSDTDQKLDAVIARMDTLTNAIGALVNVLQGKPAPAAEPPAPAPAPVPAPAPSATTPILDRPGVGGGTALGVLAAILQSTGMIDMTAPGTVGQLLPIVAGGTAALGATGWIGLALRALGTVASLRTQK